MLTTELADLDHKISLINKNDQDYIDMLYRQKFYYVTEDEIIIKLK
jgi:cell division protein FtsB